MSRKGRLEMLKSMLKDIFCGELYFKGGCNPYPVPEKRPPAPPPTMKIKNKE